jgi:hypothetical protein
MEGKVEQWRVTANVVPWWDSCTSSAIVGDGAHGKGKWDIV